MANIVAIFAHPDDESFGPGGTLIKLAKENDLYIVCVTSGELGGDKQTRENEVRDAAHLMKAKEVILLHYPDGGLSNDKYHHIADSIREILDRLHPERVLTYEQNGISGHLDHIAVSMITTFLFNKLGYIKELWYFCICKEMSDDFTDYFIYFPDGHERSKVDMVVNVADVWEERLSLVRCHESQKHDGVHVEELLHRVPKEEYFFVRKR